MNKQLSLAWEKLKGLKPVDWSLLAMVLGMLAFYDLKKLVVILQAVFLLLVAAELLINRTPLFGSKPRNLFILWYAAFFLWAALSYLWAENHSTYVQMLISQAQVAAIGIGVSYYIVSHKRLNFMFFVLALTGLVFCLRFLLSAPLNMLGDDHVRRIGRLLSFGGNRGAVMLSFVSLVLVYLAISKKKNWLYLPVVFFMFISLLFGTRVVLVFLFPGIFFLLVAHYRTLRQFLLSSLVLALAAVLTLVLITQVPLLNKIMGRRFDNLGDVLAAQRVLRLEESGKADGVAATADGVIATEDGAVATEDGAVATEDGAVATEDGAVATEDGTVATEDGTVATEDGAVQADSAPSADSQWAQKILSRKTSANTRLDLILKALEIFRYRPITGIGLDNYRFVSAPHYTYAHSTQLELLATLGLVGFGLYFWMYAYLLLKAWRHRRNNPHGELVFGFMAALFLADFFLMTYNSERDHLYLGLFAGILCLHGIQASHKETVPAAINAGKAETEAEA